MSKFSALKEVKAPTKAKQTRTKTNPQPSEKVTAKSKHPDFTGVFAYIRKNTHEAVKVALIQARSQQDFSDLVEDLLSQWLKSQKK